ncbi:hypothetical protein GGTG_04302 [Gaeumannomyces tritici R3-111a-1]|uniref:Uncharacterized protein n=1 Tax=Gaeumannomyces tritici (strain R3-111a-1) TaxID=644352 RepID=J3NSQ3_GAET3|nr:hypothetical protein GGTG_04302 [Gaeumannomyces tritici R3-111a-1]EJT79216.1 hypothetical protein GGTG_04302 [Gaeumannomyces tritici R3-111a-1]
MCTFVWTSWMTCQAEPRHRVLQSICFCGDARPRSRDDQRRYMPARLIGREVPERLRRLACDDRRHATRPQRACHACRVCASLPLDSDDLPLYDPDRRRLGFQNGHGNIRSTPPSAATAAACGHNNMSAVRASNMIVPVQANNSIGPVKPNDMISPIMTNDTVSPVRTNNYPSPAKTNAPVNGNGDVSPVSSIASADIDDNVSPLSSDDETWQVAVAAWETVNSEPSHVQVRTVAEWYRGGTPSCIMTRLNAEWAAGWAQWGGNPSRLATAGTLARAVDPVPEEQSWKGGSMQKNQDQTLTIVGHNMLPH